MRTLLALVAASLIAGAASAQSMTFRLVSTAQTKQVATVESKTAVETFTGRTDQVTGTISFNPTTKTGGGTISLPVNSIDTGIPLRNEHMQSAQWLESAKNPNITFRVSSVRHLQGDNYEVKGSFTMKGVTKPVTTTATVKMQKSSAATRQAGFKGDVLQVRSSFKVKLSDHGVKIQGQAVGKVSDEVTISVTLFGQTG